MKTKGGAGTGGRTNATGHRLKMEHKRGDGILLSLGVSESIEVGRREGILFAEIGQSGDTHDEARLQVVCGCEGEASPAHQ